MRFLRPSLQLIAIAFLGLLLTSPASANNPQPVSVSPFSGAGTTQTFVFTFSDTSGWQDLDVVNVLINNFLDGRYACYLAYSRPLNVLYLMNDPGTALLPGLALNGSGNVGNSQCTVTGAGSSATGNLNTLTLTLNISFTIGFAGNKVVYMAARDLYSNNSGWQALGTWGVPGSGSQSPAAVGVNPSGGSGMGGTFAFTFSDTARGWQDLDVVNVLINNFLDGSHACYLAYSRPLNTLYLMNDPGTALLPGLLLNQSGSVGNSQCTVDGTGSSAVGSGSTLTLTLKLRFTSGFSGNRVAYMAARDVQGGNSGWQALGTWSVSSLLVTTIEAFRDCIGAQGTSLGYTTTCQLAPNLYQSDPSYPAYSVTNTLVIGRPGITIIGLIIAGPADVTLRRANSSMLNIMAPATTSISSVTIQNITFDGNRYGFGIQGAGLSCRSGSQLTYVDLALAVGWPHPVGGTFTVQNVDFINAPDTAVVLAGGSTISYSNFGQGGAGIGPNDSTRVVGEQPIETATRFTAVYLDGGAGAYSNHISYAGTAGITLSGNNQIAYDNDLLRNRFEISDGSGGGQMTLWQNASLASVAANVIDGDNQWPGADVYGQGYRFVTGCPVTPVGSQTRQLNAGFEVNGIGHRFYNNEALNPSGSGMGIGFDSPTGQITVSSQNPWNPSDTKRYLEGSGSDGIVVVGGMVNQPPPNPPALQQVEGITLDNILVQNNAGYGVSLYYVKDSGSYIGFINGSCMRANAVNNANPYKAQNACMTLDHSQSQTYPLGSEGTTGVSKNVYVCSNAANPWPQPSSYVPSTYDACPPPPQWSSQAPPPSPMPGWPWVR